LDVKPPIASEDIRRFVKLAAAHSKGEVVLQDSDVPGLYVLTVGESVSNEIRRKSGYSIRAEAPVIFSPGVAEELATADPRSQEARLIAYGSPILEVLLDRWRLDPLSKVTLLQTLKVTDTSIVFLYRARFSGLFRREEFVPILVDLKILQAREMTLESVLQQFAVAQHPSEANTALENVDIKLDDVMKASGELWRRLFDALNIEWISSDESEYDRRIRLFEGSLNRVFSKAKAAIEVQLRRLMTLRYIQDYPNTDRLPDGEIDLRSIAGAIENSPELSDIFPLVQLEPSDIVVRGREVKEIARSFRTMKQRQALHLQLRNAGQTMRNEYSQYRKISERIKSLIAELEKKHGAQATYSLFCAFVLSNS